MVIELRPHQRDVLSKMHDGCVLWGGVGTGKTITALAYAMEHEAGRKVVVITTAKKRDSLDWVKEAALLAFPADNIIVDSWNKIQAYIDVEDALFIFDEQRLVGTGAWTKSFQKIVKKNKWILLSATPGDTWSDYAPLFVAHGWYKSVYEFGKQHAVYSRWTTYPKIERWTNEGLLQKYRKQLLVEMPMDRHTTRHIHYVECDYDKELLDIVRKRRWNVYEDKPIQNAAELFGVMRKVVSSDQDRATKLEELVATHPRLIVFYNFDYELEILRSLCEKVKESSLTDSISQNTVYMPNEVESSSLNRNPNSTKEETWTNTNSTTTTSTNERQGKKQWTDDLVEGETATSASPKDVMEKHVSNPSCMTSSGASTKSDSSPGMQNTYSSRCTTLEQGQSGSTEMDELLTSSIPTFSYAEWNGHKHQPVPETERWVYLVQYMSGSEGWNCIDTDTMAFWSLTYSWKQFWQAQGRIDRMNTPFTDLDYYVLLTDSPAEKPVIAALEQKKDFQPR